MTDESLMTAAEVARLAGVGRAAVSNWRRRYQDFPEPVAGAGSPAFRRSEVEAWLRAQGKLTALEPVDELWRALDAARGESPIDELAAAVAERLAGGRTRVPPEVAAALDAVAALPADEVMDALVNRVFARQQLSPFATPPDLAELMVELARPVGATVFDPACGTGALLAAAARAGAHRLVGQESDAWVGRFAVPRLSLHAEADVVIGDALRFDAFPDLRADTVVCDPPFGYRDWGHEHLVMDPRWEYGVPAKTETELAWVQHCLAHAKPGGTVVLVVPASVASRRSGRSIRQTMLRRGVFRAIVALPPGTLRSTGIGLQLWVLRAPDAEAGGPVLLLDVTDLRPQRRGQVDWSGLRDAIGASWREFAETGEVAEVPGRRRVVEPIDLLDEEVDLTPARHVPTPATRVDPSALDTQAAHIAELLATIRDLLPQVAAGGRGDDTTVTVNELARAGALTLTHAVSRPATTEEGSGPLVLTGRDVATGRPPTARLAEAGEHEPIELEPGTSCCPSSRPVTGACVPWSSTSPAGCSVPTCISSGRTPGGWIPISWPATSRRHRHPAPCRSPSPESTASTCAGQRYPCSTSTRNAGWASSSAGSGGSATPSAD
ncbi:N-6 DNA methylase [Prauserella oleivorans]